VIQFADRMIHIESDGSTSIGTPQEVLAKSSLTPPIVQLSRALKMPEIALTVREMRRLTEGFRSSIEIPHPSSPAPHSSTPMIQSRSVEVRYGDARALNQVSADFYPGEIVAVMGRNGAGKSTFLKTIVGITSPKSGSVEVMKSDPVLLTGRARTSLIGFIPQEPSDLLYGQSVAQECDNADKDNEVPKGRTLSILSQLVPGISTGSHPRDLSEGQRLCLAISVILSAQPQIFILDEPTRGLDYSAKAALVSIIKQIATEQNHLVILATHDVELVGEVATRTIFFSDGEIVADGPTVDVLLSSPAFAPQVAKIMAPVPWLTVNDVLKGIASSP
jgi:energy-coupling factor transport system ATP-binding protein